MIIIIKLSKSAEWSNPAIGIASYNANRSEDISGEYVPLAEYKALETHMQSLATEVYELKGLLRRWVEIEPALFNDEEWNREAEVYENCQTSALQQLLLDCKEAIK